jgi:hypothetical protein
VIDILVGQKLEAFGNLATPDDQLISVKGWTDSGLKS